MPARDVVTPRWDMWRYSPVMPLKDGETPVSLGEGLTPLQELPRLAREIGVARLWVKDEGLNPTASFKARGMSAAVTRAKALGVSGLVVPTAGNAGAAMTAYGAAAGLPVRVYAPDSTPKAILDTISTLGAQLCLVAGHIGDAGKQARAFAAESGFFDVSTLREPYRIEGKKTMGIELAEQLGWRFPTHVIYPTGGGTGLIGMWKVFAEMIRGGWLPKDIALPKNGRRTGGWLRADGASVPRESRPRHALGEPDDARQRLASAWTPRRSLDSARAVREQGRRACRVRGRHSRRDVASLAHERHGCGARGRLRARRD